MRPTCDVLADNLSSLIQQRESLQQAHKAAQERTLKQQASFRVNASPRYATTAFIEEAPRSVVIGDEFGLAEPDVQL